MAVQSWQRTLPARATLGGRGVLLLAALSAVACGGSDTSEGGDETGNDPVVPGAEPEATNTAGSGGAPALPMASGGSGGAEVMLDENGCNPETQVSCRGECFTDVGDEAAGCRLIRVSSSVLAVDALAMIAGDGAVYYSAGFGVGAIRLPSLEEEEIASAPKYVREMLLIGDALYITTQASDSGTIGPGTVQRVPLSGEGALPLVTGATGAGNLAVVGETAFFTIGFGTLYSVPIDASAEAVQLTPSTSSLLGDGTDLIFAEAAVTNFPIKVAPADDLEMATELVAEAFDPELLTVLDGFLYYIDDDTTLSRVARDGGTVEVIHSLEGFHSVVGAEVFSSTTMDGNGTALSTPIEGGSATEIATFSSSIVTISATSTHFYVSVSGGAIFEIAR